MGTRTSGLRPCCYSLPVRHIMSGRHASKVWPPWPSNSISIGTHPARRERFSRRDSPLIHAVRAKRMHYLTRIDVLLGLALRSQPSRSRAASAVSTRSRPRRARERSNQATTDLPIETAMPTSRTARPTGRQATAKRPKIQPSITVHASPRRSRLSRRNPACRTRRRPPPRCSRCRTVW